MFTGVEFTLPDGEKPVGVETTERFALSLLNKLAANGVSLGDLAFAMRTATIETWPDQKVNARVEGKR